MRGILCIAGIVIGFVSMGGDTIPGREIPLTGMRFAGVAVGLVLVIASMAMNRQKVRGRMKF